MQRKFAVIVDDGVARIGASLESYDNIRLLSEHIGNLAFSLVSQKPEVA